MNIRPKPKLAETVQMVVFGAETETETEFRSVSKGDGAVVCFVGAPAVVGVLLCAVELGTNLVFC